MIHKGTLLEARLDVYQFFCRVPTLSHIADGPLRLDFKLYRALGAEESKVPHDLLRRYALGVGDV